jgi:hypothetical protein
MQNCDRPGQQPFMLPLINPPLNGQNVEPPEGNSMLSRAMPSKESLPPHTPLGSPDDDYQWMILL